MDIQPWKKYKGSTERMISAAEIAAVLGVSASFAYKVIRNGNKELKDRGYFTVPGKLPRAFFNEKFYGKDGAA